MRPMPDHARPWRSGVLCVALFSVVPVPAGWVPVADRGHARAALSWLPVLGVACGAAAGGAAVGLHRAGPLVGAVAAFALLALITRGLHLDGLADLADGLGSRQPADRAQEVMRRSDIGPFGVAALVLVLLLDVASFAAVLTRSTRPEAVVLLLAVAGFSRAAAVVVAGRELPAARATGFGALVTGSQGPTARSGALLLPLAIVVLAGPAVGFGPYQVTIIGVAGLVSVALSYGLAWHAARRLGGISGDVFGACIEVACAASLLICAAAL
jgi:adenosylcobinamide-GDP ribazoletransferase